MLLPAFVTVPASTPSPLAGHHARAAVRSEPLIRAERLFALRERRRIAAYLRMRLLELREAGLERAADAVARRLPADVLIPR
jgi:hypothetical protein